MVSKARKLVNEQVKFAGEQAKVLRDAPGNLMRQAATRSARGVRALTRPAEVVTRSGLRLATLSQHTAQSLLELQLDIVTTALTNAAKQLDHVARARSVRAIVGNQATELKAARDRIAKDVRKVVDILKRAGKDVRAVAKDTLDEVRTPAPAAPARRRKTAKPRTRKAKRAVKKTRR
jgi:phasin family protein